MQKKKQKLLPPVRPNAGLEAVFRAKLRAVIEEMANSYEYWIKATFKANEPAISLAMDEDRRKWWTLTDNTNDPEVLWGEIPVRVTVYAMDATPAAELQRTLNKLAQRWDRKFDQLAKDLARFFAMSSGRRSDEALKRILRKGGFSVEFKMTPEMRDIIRATLAENVGLIKTIPQRYHADVQGSVMRSVQTGRDLSTLSKELRKNFNVSYDRAALIARDQNNKATSAMQRARQTELGFTEGVWIHSHGGKTPRRTHVAKDQKKFNIQEGWFDPDPKVRKRILPGELINCRCVWRPVMKGLT